MKKEVTVITTLEVTSIHKMEAHEDVELNREKLVEDLKNHLEADDVVVTNVQKFEKDIPEPKKPKLVFDSEEVADTFFYGMATETGCPNYMGLTNTEGCDSWTSAKKCIECWKNAFDWRVENNAED